MPLRLTPIVQNEYFHIFNRGNRKQVIFQDERDYARFLFLILCCQSPAQISNIRRFVDDFVQHPMLNKRWNIFDKVAKERPVELHGFCLMPNHFHLLVYSAQNNGIPNYMQRILNAYTKYFNTRYELSGHLFQGPYKAKRIRNEKQLLYTSAYIHRNPRELRGWKNKEHRYPWSSYCDYVDKNRWGSLLFSGAVNPKGKGGEYKKFVDWTRAKEPLSPEGFLPGEKM
ncbi:MAG: transposase [Parcubacteria group bacterium]|nr:transposase [Parcubacteria group bacterium]